MLSGFLSSGNLCLIHCLKLFLTSRGLNGLHQKGCHILVKDWIFYPPFHKKSTVLIILVPVMVRSSGSGGFLGNWALETVEASEVAEADEVGEVFKAWKITTESSRFLNSIILGLIIFILMFCKKNFFDRIMKIHVEF